MEKISQLSPSVKIVITGPESTGKSNLAQQLAHHYNGFFIDEYARKYILTLGRPYQYNDLEIIARKQIADMANIPQHSGKLFFVDTYLIITKVWFEVVFKKYPLWLEDELLKSQVDLFLLCAPDIPWVKDDVRENGGQMREWLFQEYERNLIKYNFTYRIVEGFGSSRFKNAISHIESLLSTRLTF